MPEISEKTRKFKKSKGKEWFSPILIMENYSYKFKSSINKINKVDKKSFLPCQNPIKSVINLQTGLQVQSKTMKQNINIIEIYSAILDKTLDSIVSYKKKNEDIANIKKQNIIINIRDKELKNDIDSRFLLTDLFISREMYMKYIIKNGEKFLLLILKPSKQPTQNQIKIEYNERNDKKLKEDTNKLLTKIQKQAKIFDFPAKNDKQSSISGGKFDANKKLLNKDIGLNLSKNLQVFKSDNFIRENNYCKKSEKITQTNPSTTNSDSQFLKSRLEKGISSELRNTRGSIISNYTDEGVSSSSKTLSENQRNNKIENDLRDTNINISDVGTNQITNKRIIDEKKIDTENISIKPVSQTRNFHLIQKKESSLKTIRNFGEENITNISNKRSIPDIINSPKIPSSEKLQLEITKDLKNISNNTENSKRQNNENSGKIVNEETSVKSSIPKCKQQSEEIHNQDQTQTSAEISKQKSEEKSEIKSIEKNILTSTQTPQPVYCIEKVRTAYQIPKRPSSQIFNFTTSQNNEKSDKKNEAQTSPNKFKEKPIENIIDTYEEINILQSNDLNIKNNMQKYRKNTEKILTQPCMETKMQYPVQDSVNILMEKDDKNILNTIIQEVKESSEKNTTQDLIKNDRDSSENYSIEKRFLSDKNFSPEISTEEPTQIFKQPLSSRNIQIITKRFAKNVNLKRSESNNVFYDEENMGITNIAANETSNEGSNFELTQNSTEISMEKEEDISIKMSKQLVKQPSNDSHKKKIFKNLIGKNKLNKMESITKKSKNQNSKFYDEINNRKCSENSSDLPTEAKIKLFDTRKHPYSTITSLESSTQNSKDNFILESRQQNNSIQEENKTFKIDNKIKKDLPIPAHSHSPNNKIFLKLSESWNFDKNTPLPKQPFFVHLEEFKNSVALLKTQPGTFIIVSDLNDICELYVKTIQNSIAIFNIKRNPMNLFFISGQLATFPSIFDLISYYTKNPIILT